MKKFIMLIMGSFLVGMLGAYVTSASALSASCAANPSQLECCVPNGTTFCGGDDHVYNSCGSRVTTCNVQGGEYCSQNGTQASCMGAGPVDINGPINMCQSPTVARNYYGVTVACNANELCVVGQGCTAKQTNSCKWQCMAPDASGYSFQRWNNCADVTEVCAGGCDDATGQCKPGVCHEPYASQQKCSPFGNVVNGCNEVVEQCQVGYTCLASATSQSCHCVPDPRPDVCPNIAGVQMTVPSGKQIDGSGDCTDIPQDGYSCPDGHQWGTMKNGVWMPLVGSCSVSVGQECAEGGGSNDPVNDPRVGAYYDANKNRIPVKEGGTTFVLDPILKGYNGGSRDMNYRGLTCANMVCNYNNRQDPERGETGVDSGGGGCPVAPQEGYTCRGNHEWGTMKDGVWISLGTCPAAAGQQCGEGGGSNDPVNDPRVGAYYDANKNRIPVKEGGTTFVLDPLVKGLNWSAPYAREMTYRGLTCSKMECNYNGIKDNGETGVDSGGGGCPAGPQDGYSCPSGHEWGTMKDGVWMSVGECSASWGQECGEGGGSNDPVNDPRVGAYYDANKNRIPVKEGGTTFVLDPVLKGTNWSAPYAREMTYRGLTCSKMICNYNGVKDHGETSIDAGGGGCEANYCDGTMFTVSTLTPAYDQMMTISCNMSNGNGFIWADYAHNGIPVTKKLGQGTITFSPSDEGLTIGENITIRCTSSTGFDVSGNYRECGTKTINVSGPKCNRSYSPNEPYTVFHRITLGQQISFKCDVQAYGAWYGLYKIIMPELMWQDRLIDTNKFFGDIWLRMAGNPFGWNGEWFATQYNMGKISDKGSIFDIENYDSNGITHGALVSGDVVNGAYTFQPQHTGMFFAQCYPRAKDGNGYATSYDIAQCGEHHYIIVDATGYNADVSISKSADKTIFSNTTGEIVTWVVNYKNNGPDTAAGITIVDMLPDGLVYDDTFDTGGTVFSSIISLGNNKIQWKLNKPLTANESGSIVFKSKYTGGKVNNTAMQNLVTITTSSPGDDTKNNAYVAITRPNSVTTLGDTLWYDVDGNGLQGASEGGVSGMILNLYECSSSMRGLTLWKGGAGDPNMPSSYQGTKVASVTTTSSGKYKFTVDPAKLYYVEAKGLPIGYGFTKQFAGGYTVSSALNSDFSALTSRSTCEYPDLDVDGGVVVKDPVSCDSIILNAIPTSTGSRIDYQCTHTKATTASFTLLSGSTVVATANGFTGSVFAVPGTYTGVCTVDGSISYKVVSYTPPVQLSCPYKRHNASGVTCAVKSNLAPFSGYLTDLNNLILIPNPIQYCNASQIADTNYLCIDSPAGSKILTQDLTSCTASGVVVKKLASLGDYVWDDLNKDGIQDANEKGLLGVTVSLYSCDNTTSPVLLSTTTTNASGNYIFNGLVKGNYYVSFTKPASYEWSPRVSTNPALNSDGPISSCIALDPNGAVSQDMTLDAGVYTKASGPCDPEKICCSEPCNGVSTPDPVNFCGDGHTGGFVKLPNGSVVSEQCDNGNNASADGCSNTCQIESPIGHISTGKQIVDVNSNPLQCGMIDPPDVMMGEYVPFWWKYDTPNDVVQVSNCDSLSGSNTSTSKTYVLNTTDTTDGQLCEFYLRNGAGEKTKSFYKYCNVKQDYNSSILTRAYMNGVSNVVKTSYNNAMGASYVAPGHWINDLGDNAFTKFGEYQIVWDKTTYRTCDRIETTNTSGDVVAVNYVKSTNRWVADSASFASHAYCTMNFTVTKPYVTQQNGLSVSTEDLQVMNNIIDANGHPIITQSPSTTTSNTSFAGSANLTYLTKQFVQKYTQLATKKTNIIGGITAKTTENNSKIYVLSPDQELYSTSDLGNITILVPEGNLTIKGSIKGNVMVIVPNGNIVLQLNTSLHETQDQPNNQSVQGIYIAKKIISEPIFNIDINTPWRFGGQLSINGLLVNTESNVYSIKTLKDARRSSLTDYTTNPHTSWFDVISSKRGSIVTNGASVKISTSPSLWTNLPPGANELMKELQSFR